MLSHGISTFSGITVFNKMYSGRDILLFLTRADLEKFIQRLNEDGVVEQIANLFIVPSCLFDASTLGQDYAYTDRHEFSTSYTPTDRFDWYKPPFSDTVKTITKTVDKNTSFTGFTPKNNKVKCYPWNYLMVSNNVGKVNILKYEDFSTSNCQFDLIGALTIGGSFKLIPKNYKGVTSNYDESMSLAKFPTCSWSSDAFTNWLTQEAANEVSGGVTTIAQGALSGASVRRSSRGSNRGRDFNCWRGSKLFQCI